MAPPMWGHFFGEPVTRKLAPALVLLVICCAYLPGLGGGYKLDDHVNLLTNSALAIDSISTDSLMAAATSGTAGPTGRPVAMLSFATDYYFHRLDPKMVLGTNVGLHLLTAVAVFWVLFQLFTAATQHEVDTRDPATALRFALVGMAIWALSPMHASTVLYAVQRMTILSALFATLAIALYLSTRLKNGSTKPLWLAVRWLGITTLVILSGLSKENGLLAAPIIVLLEMALFQREHAHWTNNRKRLALICLILITLGFALLAANYADRILASYATREFTLGERLWTQCRVVLSYAWNFLCPLPSQLAFYSDDWAVSTGPMSPPTTGMSALLLVASTAVAIVVSRWVPVVTVGILWYLIGHGMESTLIGLELRFEHRNYFPSIGLSAFLAYAVLSASDRWCMLDSRLALGAIAAVLTTMLTVRTVNWSDPLVFAYYESDVNPSSVRAQTQLASALVKQGLQAESPAERETFLFMAENQAEQAVRRSADHDAAAYFTLIHVREHIDAGVSAKDATALAERLARPPLANGDVASLVGMSQCIATRTCSIEPQWVVEFHLAALRHANLPKRRRCLLRISLGSAYQTLAKFDEAIHHATTAVEMCPAQPELHLQQAAVFAQAGRVADARRALWQAAVLDRWNEHSESITRIQQAIQETG